MDETMDWYDGFQWDITVDNGTISSEQCAPELVKYLCSQFPSFSTSLPELACKTIKLSSEEEIIIRNSPKRTLSLSSSSSSSSPKTPEINAHHTTTKDDNPHSPTKVYRTPKSSPINQTAHANRTDPIFSQTAPPFRSKELLLLSLSTSTSWMSQVNIKHFLVI
eukprot:gnl/Chilomastix_caulleri/1948.p1 GENE.gnl/Chilomastix_caulleri/1948~~gnl/Chilomastix_caulleri/1948.p1  ORF type:complete len:164 (-),score=49.68 gnl/Chilomastix_caulleri/1948:147-638(-)